MLNEFCGFTTAEEKADTKIKTVMVLWGKLKDTALISTSNKIANFFLKMVNAQRKRNFLIKVLIRFSFLMRLT